MKKLYNQKKESFFEDKERIFQTISSLDEQIAAQQIDFDQVKLQAQLLNVKIATKDQEQYENHQRIEKLNYNLEQEIQRSNEKHIELDKQKTRLEYLKSRNMLKLNNTSSRFNAVKKDKKTQN